jgi:hypothetical protein
MVDCATPSLGERALSMLRKIEGSEMAPFEFRFAKRDYGVPDGAPAMSHENARNEDEVRSIAGSTVE